MTTPHIITLFLVYISFGLQAQSHIPVSPNLSGEELMQTVVSDFKPTFVLDYGAARDIMYGSIYNVNDSVSCVYANHTLYLPPNADPSSFLFMNGSSDGINTEHTYPRSKGASEENGNAFSDMHHLFPTRAGVNAARSNFPFGDIPDNQTTGWYFLDQAQSNIPTSDIDAYSERHNNIFEPREDHKGNVARAMFYFFSMYEEEALEADASFFEKQRATLCRWHHLDPVDQAEWERTFRIAEYQDDLPNPFVLDCSLASRSYCQALNSTHCVIPTNVTTILPEDLTLYPNPIHDVLHVTLNGTSTLSVFDILGRSLWRKIVSNNTSIDFSSFPNGTYFVEVDNSVFKVIKGL